MTDLSQYREQVAQLGQMAQQAEADEKFEAAFQYYKQALDVFMHMIKCKQSNIYFVIDLSLSPITCMF
jgi:hypothetical protein